MYALARALQLAGLVILPVSIFAQLQEQLTLWQSLTLSAFGVLAFSLGYMLQGLGGGQGGGGR